MTYFLLEFKRNKSSIVTKQMAAVLCFTLFVLIPGSLGLCFVPPITNISTPCSIRNLTIIDSMSHVMASNYQCNETIHRLQLEQAPSINFTTYSHETFKNSKFSLVVFDSTSKELLWLIRNITTNDNRLVPFWKYSKPVIVRPYQSPANSTYLNQQIEFYVFEEKYNNQYFLLSKTDTFPFNLKKFLENEWNSGSLFCGPVATSQLTIRNLKPKQHSNYPIQGANFIPFPGSHIQAPNNYPNGHHSPYPQHQPPLYPQQQPPPLYPHQQPPQYGWSIPNTSGNNFNKLAGQGYSAGFPSAPHKRNVATYIHQNRSFVYFIFTFSSYLITFMYKV